MVLTKTRERIVKMCDSRRARKGNCLPISTTNARCIVEMGEQTEISMENGTYRIMVVDDEPDIAEGIAVTLSALTGLHFSPFSNAMQALSAFKNQPYDLVLTDLTMPGIGGFDLVSQIKKIRPGTDFIIITAHKSLEVVHHSHLLGAMKIFYKPFNIEELERAVQNCHQKFLFWKDRFQEVTSVNR